MTAEAEVLNLPLANHSLEIEVELLQSVVHQHVDIVSCHDEIVYDVASGVNLAQVFSKFAQTTPVKIPFVKLELTDGIFADCQSLHAFKIYQQTF